MEKMQTIARLRSLRIAPRKVRLVVDLIRGMKVQDAMNQLYFSKKVSATAVLKLLKSAIANAKHNHGMNEDTLVIKTAFVDGGKTLHRSTPRAMGRATPIRKRTAHITLVLEGESGKQGKQITQSKQEEEKKEVKEIKEKNTKVKTTKKAKKIINNL